MTEIDERRRALVLAAASGAELMLSAAAPIRVNAKLGMCPSAAPFGPIQRARTPFLEVAYHDLGPRNGRVVLLFHGFPYDVHSYVDVAPMLALRGFRVIVPYLRGHGATRFLDSATPRSGEQAALGDDVIALMNALGIKSAILAGYDWGGRAACVAAALWPDRVAGLVSVNGYLIHDISAAARPLGARVERGFWYQFYFLTERGRAGLTANRRDIARILWRDNSPSWAFDEATFARTAAAFDNPDYVDVVIHSYRHRLGAATGSPHYLGIADRLAAVPAITVPAITLDGTADGVVPPTNGRASAAMFTGARIHRQIPGVGHNLPQEASAAFAHAIIEVASLRAGSSRLAPAR